ncbi:MAG TPA: hypothetical protein VLH79_06855 [Chthonomonadales bacterium]|nr:hypothetical protein [Chthonomonadales bacterium]
MADISITAASVLASSSAVIEKRYTFGATVTGGQGVVLDDNEQWQPYDSNGTTNHEITRKRGIALHGGASGQPAAVCLKDADFTPGGPLTNGTAVYASTTAGGIAHDIPTTGAYPVCYGLPKSTTKMNLLPVASGAVM